MKRFLTIFIMLILTTCVYAETKVTEKQLEDFENKGSYIKVIILRNDSRSVSYYNKQSIFEIFLKSDGNVYIINDNGERVSFFETDGLERVELDSNNNLILTYRF